MATWTWQRVNGAGVAVDRGALYRSLPECFATLRANRAEFGIAPVRINLDGAGVRGSRLGRRRLGRRARRVRQ